MGVRILDRSTFEKEYEVQYYEIDVNGKLLVTSLMNYFGDIATSHSQVVGVSFDYLIGKHIAWVLYKWNINITRYPSYGEKIIIKTKACSFRKFYAYRTFEVLDQKNNIIAGADSIWILIDINRRRILRITEDMYEMYGVSRKDKGSFSVERIKLPQRFTIEKSFEVRYSDIDTNRHVNNVKYVDWVIETIPLDIIVNYYVKNLNITYEKEAVYGENVTIFTEFREQDGGYISLHEVLDGEGKRLSAMEVILEKR